MKRFLFGAVCAGLLASSSAFAAESTFRVDLRADQSDAQGWEDVKNIATAMAPGAKVAAVPANGIVTVIDASPEQLLRIEHYVRDLNKVLDQQFVIHVTMRTDGHDVADKEVQTTTNREVTLEEGSPTWTTTFQFVCRKLDGGQIMLQYYEASHGPKTSDHGMSMVQEESSGPNQVLLKSGEELVLENPDKHKASYRFKVTAL